MKPGYKTSELWSCAAIVTLLGNTMENSTDWRVLCMGCASLAIVAAAYMHSRTSQKKAPDAEVATDA